MKIPDFNHNHVLPPHLGNPTKQSDLSPYDCSIHEFCIRFATSKKRVQLLKKFIEFRKLLTYNGIIFGFQWVDGSFTQNIEVSEGRAPNDLDLVTFYGNLTSDHLLMIKTHFPEFANPILSKNRFQIDHYNVDFTYTPEITVEYTKYWIQLFTHTRSNIWKGIIKLSLNTPSEDDIALNYLNALKL